MLSMLGFEKSDGLKNMEKFVGCLESMNNTKEKIFLSSIVDLDKIFFPFINRRYLADEMILSFVLFLFNCNWITLRYCFVVSLLDIVDLIGMIVLASKLLCALPVLLPNTIWSVVLNRFISIPQA